MKKIIYTAIALGSLVVLNANQEKFQADQITPNQNWNSTIVNQNQTREDVNPMITSVDVNTQEGMIYCYLTTPIPSNYSSFFTFGDHLNLGSQLTDDSGNITGYSISLSDLAQMSYAPSEISKNINIRLLNNTTSKITDFSVDNQELKDIINNISQVHTVNPVYSGDKVISGTATPNTNIYIATYTDLDKEAVIAQGQSDENGNFNISLTEPILGYSFFTVMSIGKYYESDSENVITQIKDTNENLFLNTTFTNQAKGWITTGAQQTITPSTDTDTQVNFKTLSSYAHVGAVQYKTTQNNQKMKMSMDIRINSLPDLEYGDPSVILGTVEPGGVQISNTYNKFAFSEMDLGKWIHLEYDVSTQSFNLPVGFTTYNITDIDVKNVSLTPVS